MKGNSAKMKLSIKKKTVIMVITFALVLISSSVILCGRVISNQIDRQYRLRATNLVKTVAQVIDVEKFLRVRDAVIKIFNETENRVGSEEWGSDAFNEYTARYSDVENDDDFITLREDLRKIQDVNDVECLYMAYIDRETESFLYIIDAAYEDACPPGCIDPIYDVNKPVLTDPEYGFPAYITNTPEYGWLLTAGVPIHDGDGEVVGYVLTDLSMDAIKMSQLDYILRLIVFLSLATAILCVISIIIVNQILIKPIKTLSDAAIGYHKNEDSGSQNTFEKIKINTHDELATLAGSMKQMERDINDHISRLLSVNKELTISKHFANEMTALANKDALTGVKNKTAYDADVATLDAEIKNGIAEFGIAMVDLNFLKHTNDTYGHENGNISIIDLSNVICDTFAHSPVYRIGGDEFVVVLKDRDFHNIKTLEERFNEKIDSLYNDKTLDPWKRISAAFGYASFDPEKDKSVLDVFNRADGVMYEHKKKLKESGHVKISQT